MLLMRPRLQRVKETCTCEHAVCTHTHTHTHTHIQSHTQTPLLSPTMKSRRNYQRNDSPADLQRSPLISIHLSFLSPSASQPLNSSVISDVSLSLFPCLAIYRIFFFLLCLSLATLSVIAFCTLVGLLFNKQQTDDINNVAGNCFFRREVGIMIQLISLSLCASLSHCLVRDRVSARFHKMFLVDFSEQFEFPHVK